MNIDWFNGFALLYLMLVVGWLLLSNAKARMLRRWILRRRRPDIAALSTDELWSFARTFGYVSAAEYSTTVPDGVRLSVHMKVGGQDFKSDGRGDTLRAALLDAIGKALVIEQKLNGLASLRALQSRDADMQDSV